MFDQKAFGEKIRFYRKERHLTLEKLSEMADISFTYLSEIEHGKHCPTIEVIAALLNALNINYSILMGGADNEGALNSAIINGIQDLDSDELKIMKTILSNLKV